jgi:hydrogenase maturation protease
MATSGHDSLAGRVLIVGFGNPLMGDDGAGPAVIEALRARALPDGVRAEQGETDSLRLLSLWHGEGNVWLVDSVVHGAPPGTIHRLEHDEVLAVPQRHSTVHQLSLPESLRWLAVAAPEMATVRYLLWGIEPHRIALTERLSPAVAAAVARLASRLLASLR